jgi:hypothetical protein
MTSLATNSKKHLQGLPGYRWLLTTFTPVQPKFLSVIGADFKREDKTGILWMRDFPTSVWFPDVSDPATLGVLLAKVREVYADEHIDLRWGPLEPDTPYVWYVNLENLLEDVYGNTEGEALVRALEAKHETTNSN